MNTISIDSRIYGEALSYATKKKMSVSDLFELAVRKLMDKSPVSNTSDVTESAKYAEALDLMEDIVSDSYSNIHVPADEDGRDARVEKYLQ